MTDMFLGQPTQLNAFWRRQDSTRTREPVYQQYIHWPIQRAGHCREDVGRPFNHLPQCQDEAFFHDEITATRTWQQHISNWYCPELARRGAQEPVSDAGNCV